jgi:cytochrome P450
VLLLFAGHETTTHHIANGLRALLAFPAELARLRERPDLAASAVRRLLLLRWPHRRAGPHRAAAPDGARQGVCPGERVFLLMNAANRDPRAYEAPDRLDLQRHGVPHLTFRFRRAYLCLGFPLARLEGQIALPALLARWRRSSSRRRWNGSTRWCCAA